MPRAGEETTVDRPLVLLDGQTASCAQVRDVARTDASAAVTAGGLERARAAAQLVADVAERMPVYGRTTGGGANRDQVVTESDMAEQGYPLMPSHSGVSGPLLAAD